MKLFKLDYDKYHPVDVHSIGDWTIAKCGWGGLAVNVILTMCIFVYIRMTVSFRYAEYKMTAK